MAWALRQLLTADKSDRWYISLERDKLATGDQRRQNSYQSQARTSISPLKSRRIWTGQKAGGVHWGKLHHGSKQTSRDPTQKNRGLGYFLHCTFAAYCCLWYPTKINRGS